VWRKTVSFLTRAKKYTLCIRQGPAPHPCHSNPPNGNIVVTDRDYDAQGPVFNVSAAYLHNGRTLELISVLTGTRAGPNVGIAITVLTNGNYPALTPTRTKGR
jgi:hypothetical protein